MLKRLKEMVGHSSSTSSGNGNAMSPHLLWENVLSKERQCNPAHTLSIDTPISPSHVRFVCVSDTHQRFGRIMYILPPGDVLLHCGDFTNVGDRDKIIEFNAQLGKLSHPHKIVIAGNHELGLQDDEDMELRCPWFRDYGTPKGYELLSNCTYLMDSAVTIYGINIYGSPWTIRDPEVAGWAFQKERGEQSRQMWEKIPGADDPNRIDVLMTHGPPLGHSDACERPSGGVRVGCADLLDQVEQRIKPLFHVFGHIHEGYGATTNGYTTFINASTANRGCHMANEPIIFDIPLPAGIVKEDSNDQIVFES